MFFLTQKIYDPRVDDIGQILIKICTISSWNKE